MIAFLKYFKGPPLEEEPFLLSTAAERELYSIYKIFVKFYS